MSYGLPMTWREVRLLAFAAAAVLLVGDGILRVMAGALVLVAVAAGEGRMRS